MATNTKKAVVWYMDGFLLIDTSRKDDILNLALFLYIFHVRFTYYLLTKDKKYCWNLLNLNLKILKQCFERSSIDTIWADFQANLSWMYHQIVSIEGRSKHFFLNALYKNFFFNHIEGWLKSEEMCEYVVLT